MQSLLGGLKMTPEEQRIAITEACGWTETEAWLNGRRCFEHADSNAGWDFDSLPDYLNDLNAIHAAIATLPFDHQITVAELLAGDLVDVMQATAAQRCEAFLRTIGNWTND